MTPRGDERGGGPPARSPRPASARGRIRPPAVEAHAELIRLVRELRGKRVLVHADLLVDEFVITGEPRVSREAPVLILRYKQRTLVPGGGANAAANVAALGGTPVVVGEVGDDSAGEALVAMLRDAGADVSALLIRPGCRTPRKTRFLAGDKNVALQQVVRVDRIEAFPRDAATAAAVKANVARLLPTVDAVLVSDYGLGFVDPASVKELILDSPDRRGMRVALDSRTRMFEYPGVDVATPSEIEVEAALGVSLTTPRQIEAAGRQVLERLSARAVVVTRGSQGMVIFEANEPADPIPAFGTGSVADVTGAGDTVIATLTLALAGGGTFAQGARLANVAAGIAVTKMGTATVTPGEIIEALEAI